MHGLVFVAYFDTTLRPMKQHTPSLSGPHSLWSRSDTMKSVARTRQDYFPQPVLSILLELGATEMPLVRSVDSFSPSFHVTGAGSAIFGCLAQDEGRLLCFARAMDAVFRIGSVTAMSGFGIIRSKSAFPSKVRQGGGNKTEDVIGASGAEGLDMDIDG